MRSCPICGARCTQRVTHGQNRVRVFACGFSVLGLLKPSGTIDWAITNRCAWVSKPIVEDGREDAEGIA
jgi:hypothetical protein